MNVCTQGGNEEVFFDLCRTLSQERDLLINNFTVQLEHSEDSSYYNCFLKDIRCYILPNSQCTINSVVPYFSACLSLRSIDRTELLSIK